VHIELVPWTLESGLLTSTLKKKRFLLTKKYESVVDQLYLELEREILFDSSVSSSFLQLLGNSLGYSPQFIGESTKFSEIGGDSLAAVNFISILNSLQGNKKITISHLAKHPLSVINRMFMNDSLISSIEESVIDWNEECKVNLSLFPPGGVLFPLCNLFYFVFRRNIKAKN